MTTSTLDPNTKDPEYRANLEHCIDVCNSILRGEISAIEAYDKAIEKFPNEEETEILRQIREEHKISVRFLKENVLEMHGLPETNSGSWGSFTSAIQTTANFFGEESALRSLQQGEELGRSAYEDALADENVMPDCKRLMRDRLLPAVNQHISKLETISEALNNK